MVLEFFDFRFKTKTVTKAASTADECQVTPVIHVLQYPGCVPKPIPSFACIGRCASYLQVRMIFKNVFNTRFKVMLL